MKTEELTLSPYCEEILNKLEIKRGKYEKLTPTLLNKTKYVVHYRNLALYQELGLKVTKIHRVLTFNQDKWLEPYINFNILNSASMQQILSRRTFSSL